MERLAPPSEFGLVDDAARELHIEVLLPSSQAGAPQLPVGSKDSRLGYEEIAPFSRETIDPQGPPEGPTALEGLDETEAFGPAELSVDRLAGDPKPPRKLGRPFGAKLVEELERLPEALA